MSKINPGAPGAYKTPTTKIITVSVKSEILQASGGIPVLGESVTNLEDVLWF